jgi:HPt (histidine-containing phosphotransfer) domain-containing protein
MDQRILIEAGIDYADGINRFCGDEDFFARMLGKMLDEPTYGQMVDALVAGKTDEAFEAAHAFKGVSGNLSLTATHDAVVPLVEALRAGDLETARTLLPPVTKAYDTALAAIRQTCAG